MKLCKLSLERFLKSLAIGMTLASLTASAETARARPFTVKVNNKFVALVLGAIKPQGWMRDRAIAAMNGLIGDLDSIHRDFRISWGREFRPPLEKMSW